MNVSYAYALREVFNNYLARLVPPISAKCFFRRGGEGVTTQFRKKTGTFGPQTFFLARLILFLGLLVHFNPIWSIFNHF